ncbi:MAG: tRNA 2-thiouridine(34) synthase MnmA [Anaerolineales bacterium]
MSSNIQDQNKKGHAQPPRVVVAMSGGVDSSVAAALLVEQGFEVIGMMMRLWSEPGTGQQNRCCTPDAMAQAKRVAAQLKIPFYAIDAQEPFYNHVVKYFIEGYSRGVTPNPCLICNREIRWGLLLNHALAFEAQYMATGHYARLREESGRIQLLKAVDRSKDQSYVLHVLNQEQLSRAIFPLGEYSKNEVRQFAHRFNLPVADRPDSQDLCFLGEGDYRAFLKRNSSQDHNSGLIKNHQGEILGEHDGLAMFTIGQRRGLGLSSPDPLFVLEKDLERNELVVGTKEELEQYELSAKDVNWVSIEPPVEPIRAQVKIRYKSPEEWAVIKPEENGYAKVKFDRKIISITPGQAAVFYDEDICLGGGIIQTIER